MHLQIVKIVHVTFFADLSWEKSDCKDRLVSFSGLVPHMTMPYTKTRYTLVFFCRRKWDNMADKVRGELTEAGLRLPQRGQQLEGARDDNDDDDAEVASTCPPMGTGTLGRPFGFPRFNHYRITGRCGTPPKGG